jgi:hypothetical protein
MCFAPRQQVAFDAPVVGDLVGGAAIAVRNPDQFVHLPGIEVRYAPSANFAFGSESRESKVRRIISSMHGGKASLKARIWSADLVRCAAWAFLAPKPVHSPKQPGPAGQHPFALALPRRYPRRRPYDSDLLCFPAKASVPQAYPVLHPARRIALSDSKPRRGKSKAPRDQFEDSVDASHRPISRSMTFTILPNGNVTMCNRAQWRLLIWWVNTESERRHVG